MAKELQKSAMVWRKKNAMASTASAVLAAVSLLGVSLGISAVATGIGSGEAWADTKKPTSKGTTTSTIKLDGIEGESTDDKHKDPIEIPKETTGPARGSGVRKTTAQQLQSKQGKQQLQRSQLRTQGLRKATVKGEHIKEGQITTRKAGKDQQEYRLQSNQNKLQVRKAGKQQQELLQSNQNKLQLTPRKAGENPLEYRLPPSGPLTKSTSPLQSNQLKQKLQLNQQK